MVDVKPASLTAQSFGSSLHHFIHLLLLTLQDGYFGFEANVFLCHFVHVLLELESLRVESLFVLLDLTGKDACEVMGVVWLDGLSMPLGLLLLLFVDILHARVAPVPFVAGLGRLRST